MSALPLPSPQLPRNKTACIIHSCYSGTPNRLFIRSFLTEEKVKKDQQCKVSCSAYECSSRQHSNTFFLAILGMAEGSGQWNAFARVLLNIKPVTSLELLRQSECKKKPKGHMSVENSYTSKCMSTKNWQQSRNWILRPTEEAEQLVSIVQIMKIIQVLLLLMPGVNLYYLKLATLSTQMNCCKSIQLNEYVASSELGSNPLILKFWLKKCCILSVLLLWKVTKMA